MIANRYGPDQPCQRTACGNEPTHRGGEHIDPRSPRYDGPDTTLNALPAAARSAARALIASGASMPDVIDLAREIHRLTRQVAAVRVDADRQVNRAMGNALDCEQHGRDLRQAYDQIQHFDRLAERNDRGRLALVGGLHQLHEFADVLQQRVSGGDTPDVKQVVETLARAIKRMGDAHDRAWKR